MISFLGWRAREREREGRLKVNSPSQNLHDGRKSFQGGSLVVSLNMSAGEYPAEYMLPVSAPALVPITPVTLTAWSSTACKKPEWFAKAKKPLDSTKSASNAVSGESAGGGFFDERSRRRLSLRPSSEDDCFCALHGPATLGLSLFFEAEAEGEGEPERHPRYGCCLRMSMPPETTGLDRKLAPVGDRGRDPNMYSMLPPPPTFYSASQR